MPSRGERIERRPAACGHGADGSIAPCSSSSISMASSIARPRASPASGAALAARAAAGDDVVYVTNNAMHYHGDYLPRLEGHGAPGRARSRGHVRARERHVRARRDAERPARAGRRGQRAGARAARGGPRRRHRGARRDADEPGGPRRLGGGRSSRRGRRRARPAADLPPDRRGGRLRARRLGARGHEPRPDLPDRARLPAGRGLGGGGDRGGVADDREGHHRQARAVPARGGGEAGRAAMRTAR